MRQPYMRQGALRNNRRQAEQNTTLPVVPEARQKAQQPAARNQERYRDAIRRFCKRERSVNKENGANYRNRTDDLFITSELLYRLS